MNDGVFKVSKSFRFVVSPANSSQVRKLMAGIFVVCCLCQLHCGWYFKGEALFGLYSQKHLYVDL